MTLVGRVNLRQATAISLATLRRLWLRWTIVLGVLAASALAGVVVAKRNPLYVVIAAMAPFCLVGLQIVLRRLDLAPLIILVVAAFVPLSLPTGTGSRLVVSLLVTIVFAGVWVFRILTLEKNFRLQPSPVNRPLLGFMLVTCVSLVWSNVFRDPLVKTWSSLPVVQIASAIVMIMLPAAFLLVANFINDAKLLKGMVAAMLAAGALGVIGLFGIVRFAVNTNGLFSMWVIALAVSLALSLRQLSRPMRGALLALAGVWVYWGFGLHISWLAGWFPSLIVLGVLSFMRSKRAALVLLLVMIVVIGMRADYYLGNVINAESTESGQTRLAAWEVNWRVTSQHLLFGTGPAGYAAYYMSYFPQDGVATHSNYIDILAQTGVIGLALNLWFFFGLAWLGYRLCRRLKGRGDFAEGLANAAFAGTVGSIVIMGFGDWLYPFAYTQTIAGFDHAVYNWLFMGTILALDRLTRSGAGMQSHD